MRSNDPQSVLIKLYLATCFAVAAFGVVMFFAVVRYSWQLIGAE